MYYRAVLLGHGVIAPLTRDLFCPPPVSVVDISRSRTKATVLEEPFSGKPAHYGNQSDTQGQFSLDAPDEKVQHLIRLSHERVNYFRRAPLGSTIAEVTVYDSTKKMDNLPGEGRVLRAPSAEGQQIQVPEMYILRNEPQPPRTLSKR